MCTNFAIPRLMPGNPLIYFANPHVITSPTALEALKQRFGLDKSVWVQFTLYFQNLLSWPPNFGVSYLFYPTPVFTVIMQYLPWTLFLVGVSTLITALIGILVGIWTGSKPGSRSDTVVISLSMVLWTMPFFLTYSNVARIRHHESLLKALVEDVHHHVDLVILDYQRRCERYPVRIKSEQ